MIGELCRQAGHRPRPHLRSGRLGQHDDAAIVLRRGSRVRWARCPSCRPADAACRAPPPNWACTSIRAAAPTSCRSSADSSAATPWPASWPPAWPTPRRPTLLVDIGTNGEIVLLADGKLSAASTAAGPAFEGARISCGMRGCTGAIEKVVVDDGRLRINVIGNVPPAGLCGSGLIDVAAELLRHGIVTPQGRLLSPDQLPRRRAARSGRSSRLA